MAVPYLQNPRGLRSPPVPPPHSRPTRVSPRPSAFICGCLAVRPFLQLLAPLLSPQNVRRQTGGVCRLVVGWGLGWG